MGLNVATLNCDVEPTLVATAGARSKPETT